jgi:hypothetical protein
VQASPSLSSATLPLNATTTYVGVALGAVVGGLALPVLRYDWLGPIGALFLVFALACGLVPFAGKKVLGPKDGMLGARWLPPSSRQSVDRYYAINFLDLASCRFLVPGLGAPHHTACLCRRMRQKPGHGLSCRVVANRRSPDTS